MSETPQIVEVPDSLEGAIEIPESFENPVENNRMIQSAIAKMAEVFLGAYIGNEGTTGLMVVPNGGLLPTIMLLNELKERALDYSRIPVVVATVTQNTTIPYGVKKWFAPEDMFDEGKTYKSLLNRLNNGVDLHLSVLTKKQGLNVPQAVLDSSPGIITLPNEWIYSWAGLNSNIDNPADPELRVLERNCTVPFVKVGQGVTPDKIEEYKNFLRRHQHFDLKSSEFNLMLAIENEPDLNKKMQLFMRHFGFTMEA